jgi:dolichol kinase
LTYRRERTRRIVHLAFGGAALLVPVLGRAGSIAVAASAAVYNIVLAPALGWDRSYRRAGESRLSGIGTYPLAVLLLLCFTPPRTAMAAWGVLAVGDPAAAAAGVRWGRRALPWNRAKTWIGTLAAFVAGSAAAWALLAYAGPSPAPVGAALAAGAAGALAESLPWPIDDNLPVAAGAAAALVGVGV